jgi:hypothetical protein
MQLDEEFLRVPIKPALAHLVGMYLYERVVSTLFPHRHRERPERSSKRPGAHLVRRPLQANRWKEAVCCRQYIIRVQLRSKKMSHRSY